VHGAVQLIQTYKNYLRIFGNQLAVDESFSKRMILFLCTCAIASATFCSIFPHEPTDVEMKQTSTVFCPHWVILCHTKHQINACV